MRFKKRPQLPGAGRTRVGHHHGSHMPTSPEAVLLGKSPQTPNISVPSVCIPPKSKILVQENNLVHIFQRPFTQGRFFL